jgi:hypothetical protein
MVTDLKKPILITHEIYIWSRQTVDRRSQWSKAWVCGRSISGIAVSNSADSMDVCLCSTLWVVRYRSLRRANHLSRGVLPSVCVCVCLYFFTPTRVGRTGHTKKERKKERTNERKKERKVHRTQLDTHERTVGLLWTSDQLVAEAATNTTHIQHGGKTSLLSAGFEIAITAIKRPHAYVFDGTANGIGTYFILATYYSNYSVPR